MIYRSRAEKGEPAAPAMPMRIVPAPSILGEKREAAIRMRAHGRGYAFISKKVGVSPTQAKKWWLEIGRLEQDMLTREAQAEGIGRITEVELLRRPMARTLAIFDTLLGRIEQDISDDAKMGETSLKDKVGSLIQLIQEYRRVPALGAELDEKLAASLVKGAIVDRAIKGDVDAGLGYLRAVDPAFKKEAEAGATNITIIADKVLAMSPEQRRAHSAQLLTELTQ